MADKKALLLTTINRHNMAEGNEEIQILVPDTKGEVIFHDVRGWRFDYAYLDKKVAVEIHGGIFSKGRHVRPLGYMEDRDKVNEAQLHGWIVLEFPIPTLTDDPFKCMAQLYTALKMREGE